MSSLRNSSERKTWLLELLLLHKIFTSSLNMHIHTCTNTYIKFGCLKGMEYQTLNPRKLLLFSWSYCTYSLSSHMLQSCLSIQVLSLNSYMSNRQSAMLLSEVCTHLPNSLHEGDSRLHFLLIFRFSFILFKSYSWKQQENYTCNIFLYNEFFRFFKKIIILTAKNWKYPPWTQGKEGQSLLAITHLNYRRHLEHNSAGNCFIMVRKLLIVSKAGFCFLLKCRF